MKWNASVRMWRSYFYTEHADVTVYVRIECLSAYSDLHNKMNGIPGEINPLRYIYFVWGDVKRTMPDKGPVHHTGLFVCFRSRLFFLSVSSTIFMSLKLHKWAFVTDRDLNSNWRHYISLFDEWFGTLCNGKEAEFGQCGKSMGYETLVYCSPTVVVFLHLNLVVTEECDHSHVNKVPLKTTSISTRY